MANQGDSNRKRNTLNNLANTLYAQRQKEKKIKDEEDRRIRDEENETNDNVEEVLAMLLISQFKNESVITLLNSKCASSVSV